MTITELLNKYTETDFEKVLTTYLKDPGAVKSKVAKASPRFASLIQELDGHMHDESYDPKIEEAFHDGMLTMLQILFYLEEQQ